jgi:copper homeostasis protein
VNLEVCVADAQSLAAAVEGGATRIELCSALELGGLTPSRGLMEIAAEAGIPTYVLIRPRPGDFVFDFDDYGAMLCDIETVHEVGLDGVVLGCSRPNGEIDDHMLSRLVGQAEGLGRTLHRAIDLASDLEDAIDTAIGLEFERILTSGGAPTALEGVDRLARMREIAGGRVNIMAGAGLRPDNVLDLLAGVPVDEVHSSCTGAPAASPEALVRLGFAAETTRRTDAAVVRTFREVLAGWKAPSP